MGHRGTRVRLATNIYRDRYGIAAVVRLQKHVEEIRFPLGTPVLEIQRQADARKRQLAAVLPDPVARGSVADIVAQALKRVPEGPARNDREDLLQPWVQALGERPFFAVTRADLTAVTDGWRADGLSASRANKRISALRVAWASISPDNAPPHPIEKIPRYSEPLPVQRGLPMALVTEVLEAMPESRSRARLTLMAWTGQPPARIMAIRPEHVRWETSPPELYVVGRKKGAGARDAWLPLMPQAVDALREFFRLEAVGRFTWAPIGRSLRRAVRRTQRELRANGRADDAARLESFRPYDLRHSFLTAFGTWTTDVYATAEYAGHASLQSTRRYMIGASSDRMKAGVRTLAKAIQVGSKVPRQGATRARRRLTRKRKDRR